MVPALFVFIDEIFVALTSAGLKSGNPCRGKVTFQNMYAFKLLADDRCCNSTTREAKMLGTASSNESSQ